MLNEIAVMNEFLCASKNRGENCASSSAAALRSVMLAMSLWAMKI